MHTWQLFLITLMLSVFFTTHGVMESNDDSIHDVLKSENSDSSSNHYYSYLEIVNDIHAEKIIASIDVLPLKQQSGQDKNHQPQLAVKNQQRKSTLEVNTAYNQVYPIFSLLDTVAPIIFFCIAYVIFRFSRTPEHTSPALKTIELEIHNIQSQANDLKINRNWEMLIESIAKICEILCRVNNAIAQENDEEHNLTSMQIQLYQNDAWLLLHDFMEMGISQASENAEKISQLLEFEEHLPKHVVDDLKKKSRSLSFQRYVSSLREHAKIEGVSMGKKKDIMARCLDLSIKYGLVDEASSFAADLRSMLHPEHKDLSHIGMADHPQLLSGGNKPTSEEEINSEDCLMYDNDDDEHHSMSLSDSEPDACNTALDVSEVGSVLSLGKKDDYPLYQQRRLGTDVDIAEANAWARHNDHHRRLSLANIHSFMWQERKEEIRWLRQKERDIDERRANFILLKLQFDEDQKNFLAKLQNERNHQRATLNAKANSRLRELVKKRRRSFTLRCWRFFFFLGIGCFLAFLALCWHNWLMRLYAESVTCHQAPYIDVYSILFKPEALKSACIGYLRSYSCPLFVTFKDYFIKSVLLLLLAVEAFAIFFLGSCATLILSFLLFCILSWDLLQQMVWGVFWPIATAFALCAIWHYVHEKHIGQAEKRAVAFIQYSDAPDIFLAETQLSWHIFGSSHDYYYILNYFVIPCVILCTTFVLLPSYIPYVS